jgi:hypothetical protein
VLVLADALALSGAEVEAITAFVAGGGGLVVTGPAAVRDAHGEPLERSPLEHLLGLRFGELGRYSFPYLRLDDALAEDLGSWPLPHYGRLAALEGLADDVRVLARRTDPVLETDDDTYWHNNQPAPAFDTDNPVIVERTYGRGRVIVSAARLGNNRARLGHGAYRDLLGALVLRAAGATPEVELLGSHRGTELVLTRTADATVAHLVTGAPVVSLDVFGARQPAAIEDIADLASVRLRVPADTASAARVVDGVESPLPIVDGVVELLGVDDWETVVLRHP